MYKSKENKKKKFVKVQISLHKGFLFIISINERCFALCVLISDATKMDQDEYEMLRAEIKYTYCKTTLISDDTV